MITKPMLACPCENRDKIRFPVGVTPKIDGVRALKINGNLVSRSFKPIRNKIITKAFESMLPEGADGEIVIENGSFQDTSSQVMTINAKVDNVVVFYWFDWVSDQGIDEEYRQRVQRIEQYDVPENGNFVVKKLIPRIVNSWEELDNFEKDVLEQGFEGVMIRNLAGRYKCGRSTEREGLLLKLKRFSDAEAQIISFEELEHNENEATTDVFGHAKRSSHKEHKTLGNTLGAFCVLDPDTGTKFKIGSGFTADQRKSFWEQRDQLIGKWVKYKYFAHGVKEAPRFPVFLGFRDLDDI